MIWRVALVVLLVAGSVPKDLDVGIPPGSPLDFVRAPVTTPSGKSNDVATGGDQAQPGTGSEPGDTRTADSLPKGFPTLSRPLTRDFGTHLAWRPARPKKDGTPTFGIKGKQLAGYPPAVPNDLYMHCAAYFLMVMLHPAQVSEREIICYLIEIGEPAAYAASAAKNENKLRNMVSRINAAVGLMQNSAPRYQTKDKIEKTILHQLVLAHPYEDNFGEELLKLTDNVALPPLIKFAKKGKHRFLERNATFALRVYNNPDVLPAARELLKSNDKVVRNRALAVLIRWRDTMEVPWLIKQMTGKDEAFRTYATHALGLIGDHRATKPLISAIKRYKNDQEFLWAAIPALGRLGDKRKEVLSLLKSLKKSVLRMRDPDAPSMGQRMDAKGTRAKILNERCRIALAKLGVEEDLEWLAGRYVAEPNQRLKDEVYDDPRFREPEPDTGKVAGVDDLDEELKKLYDKLKKQLGDKPMPKPEPEPEPKPEPEPEPVKDTARTVLEKHRDELMQYPGVKHVKAVDGRIVITAESAEDADDLRMLLGKELDGVPLDVEP